MFLLDSTMEIDRKFINVVVLGLAFMLIFTAFQTMGNIQVPENRSIHWAQELSFH